MCLFEECAASEKMKLRHKMFRVKTTTTTKQPVQTGVNQQGRVCNASNNNNKTMKPRNQSNKQKNRNLDVVKL